MEMLGCKNHRERERVKGEDRAAVTLLRLFAAHQTGTSRRNYVEHPTKGGNNCPENDKHSPLSLMRGRGNGPTANTAPRNTTPLSIRTSLR